MTQSVYTPPRFASKLLSWLLKDDWETPAGDFEEFYNQIVESEGGKIADRWYRRQVFLLLPERLFEKLLWSIVMFFSHLKVAIRTLRRHKWYAAINIGGLSVGLAACILIVLFVQDELSFDRFHADSDRIVRILEARSTPDGGEQHFAYSFAPLGAVMKDELPGVEESVVGLTRWSIGRQTVQYEDHRFYESEYLYTDGAFFDIFDFDWLAGNPAEALNGPLRAVLTVTAAQKYFGELDPIGKSLNIERDGDFTVVGLIQDPPTNSHFDFSMILSLDTYRTNERLVARMTSWDSFGFLTYLRLAKNADFEAVSSGMSSILERNLNEDILRSRTPYLQRLVDIHFESSHIDFDENRSHAQAATVYMFSAIALFILLIASINYTNMATARSLQRAKEVGLRKTVGAQRGQLVRQFLAESIVTTFSALVFALLLARMALPFFNQIVGKQLSFSLFVNPWILVSLIGLLFLVGILSGSYPALLLSRFQPAIVLKGKTIQTSGANRLRQGLVVAQFTLSIGLIIASLVVADQLNYVQDKKLGFNEDQLVVVDINDGNARSNFVSMKNDLASHSSVQAVSVSSNVPGDWKNITQIDIASPDHHPDQIITSHFLGIDADFLATFEISLIDGRNISDTSLTDSLAVLVNETVASRLEIGIGDRLRIPGPSLARRFRDQVFEPTVVGIVEDFHFKSLHEDLGPMVMGYHSNPVDVIDYFTIRLDGENIETSLEHLTSVGQKYDPRHPFEYNFLDERIADFYRAETQMGNIFNLSTILAVLIACLGLFGLTAFMTSQRTKEIGVRKVLGASAHSIIILLSKDILLLIIISFALAVPPSYLLMSKWLDGFAYRTPLDIGIFLITLGLAVLVGLVTVSYQTLRAATADPVDSLRYE